MPELQPSVVAVDPTGPTARSLLATVVQDALPARSWPPGAVLHPIRVWGDQVIGLISFDHDEMARRRRAGREPLVDRTVVRLLCSLPVGEPVRLDDLTEPQRRLVARLPAGVVEVRDRRVTRHAVPCVRLHRAFVIDDDWNRGLNRASRFAAYCERVLIMPTSGPPSFALVEASFYGIGVATCGDGVRVLVAPAPQPPRFGPATWRLQELLLKTLTGAGGGHDG